ncbi:MAG: diaminopimelate decarboxylase [Fimbriimonadaceae bacterium]|nr:diaminopimelate decarboxylase [Fimbriimonadaceae bacterium]
MMPCGTLSTTPADHLSIGGCDVVELAARFGTPLYVVDEAHLRANCAAWRDALAASAPHGGRVMYASKALLTTAIARIVADCGLGLDVASGGELLTARAAGVAGSDLLLHGNFKSRDEMHLALVHGVGRVVADSLPELAQWQALATELDCRVPLLLRVNPNVKPKTHTSISVGQIDSKFGLSISAGAALEAVRQALAADRLDLLGVHCHIGSQVLGWQGFAKAAEELAAFLGTARAATGWTAREVNLGGGRGIRYLPEHQPPSVAEFVAQVVGTLLQRCAELDLPTPDVLLEPGRSIVGETGTTLYTVGPVKVIPEVRTYVSVDGGLSDNPRPEMYGAEYHVFVANRVSAPATTAVTVAGKHCETDTLFRDVLLADPQPGDLLAVQSTGAYNYAMASNYNRLPRPAMVLVNEGQAELIVRRETADDLLRCDLLPDRLAPR